MVLLRRADPVALLAAGLMVVALALPWLELKPSRIALGVGVGAFGAKPLLAAFLLALSLLLPFLGKTWAGLWLSVWALVWVGLNQGMGTALLEGQPELVRLSPAPGFWLSLLALYVFIFAFRDDWRVWIPPALLLVALWQGALSQLAPVVEYQSWHEQFGTELWRHLSLSLSAVVGAVVLGVPLGILASRGPKYTWILGFTGFLQTIPSLALFGLLLPLLATLSQRLSLELALGLVGLALLTLRLWLRIPLLTLVYAPVVLLALVMGGVWLNALLGPDPFQWVLGAPLQESGVRGIGAAPAVLALSLYALLPLVSGVYAGLKNVPEAVRDAGLGMGMSAGQLFWQVEFPLALPLLLAGLRSAATLTIGITTVAALIGAGGLGFFILRGVEGGAPDMVLMGAIPVIGLALIVDAGLNRAGDFIKQRVGL